MKIEISNFGPINYFKCDLDKDLHLIVGKNNIGKSYAITIVYLVLKSLIEIEEIGAYHFFRMKIFDPTSSTKKIPKNISNENVKNIFQDSIKEIMSDHFLSKMNYSFIGTFDVGSMKNIHSKDNTYIKLYFTGMEIIISINKNINADKNIFTIDSILVTKSIKIRDGKQKRNYKESKTEITIYNCTNDEKHLHDSFLYAVMSFYFDKISEVVRNIKSIHYLPASRSGLYQALTAFGQIVAQLSKSRSFVNERIELPAISAPLSDYFIELSGIKINKKQYENTPVNKIADDIENNILAGKVEFDSNNKKLFYTPDGSNLKIDIRMASSMVSEISPIVVFLRHVLTSSPRKSTIRFQADLSGSTSDSKSLIFIEEPEAHLHPENQIKLLDYFVKLLGCNVKMFITSHSNYLFNKLNNLILSKSIDFKNVEAIIFKQNKYGSDGISLQIDELGIEDENFLDVAEELYEEKIDLVERLNRNA